MRARVILFSLLALWLPTISFAGYIGPNAIIKGGWGSGDLDFGFEYEDTTVSFPGIIFLDALGNIFIGDGVNSRVKIYSSTGVWQRNFTYKKITVPFGGWPANLRVKAGVGVFSIYKELQKYDYNGNLIWSIGIPGTRDYWVLDDGSIILQDIQKKYHKYSPAGKFLETYTKRPLELGVVEKEGTADGYKYTVQYSDISAAGHTTVYTIILPPGYIKKFTRDMLGNLYAIAPAPGRHSNDIVYRYGLCEDSITKMQIPDSQYNITYIKDKPHPIGKEVELIAAYGQPVVAPNGDLYTWKRTPDNYSILKWTWQGEPGAPQSLKAVSSKTGITLSWENPLEDADRVDEYEINRSYNVCGPFRPIGTVKKGILTYEDQKVKPGDTYYYQIRAIRDETPSGYSNKAIGKR